MLRNQNAAVPSASPKTLGKRTIHNLVELFSIILKNGSFPIEPLTMNLLNYYSPGMVAEEKSLLKKDKHALLIFAQNNYDKLAEGHDDLLAKKDKYFDGMQELSGSPRRTSKGHDVDLPFVTRMIRFFTAGQPADFSWLLTMCERLIVNYLSNALPVQPLLSVIHYRTVEEGMAYDHKTAISQLENKVGQLELHLRRCQEFYSGKKGVEKLVYATINNESIGESISYEDLPVLFRQHMKHFDEWKLKNKKTREPIFPKDIRDNAEIIRLDMEYIQQQNDNDCFKSVQENIVDLDMQVRDFDVFFTLTLFDFHCEYLNYVFSTGHPENYFFTIQDVLFNLYKNNRFLLPLNLVAEWTEKLAARPACHVILAMLIPLIYIQTKTSNSDMSSKVLSNDELIRQSDRIRSSNSVDPVVYLAHREFFVAVDKIKASQPPLSKLKSEAEKEMKECLALTALKVDENIQAIKEALKSDSSATVNIPSELIDLIIRFTPSSDYTIAWQNCFHLLCCLEQLDVRSTEIDVDVSPANKCLIS